MKLEDITKDLDKFIEERIDYIFKSFQKVFPDVRYDERATIVGIGEPNKYLLCYFRKTEDNNILVKFKANEAPVVLMESIDNINSYIQSTIIMFQENNFPKKQKKELPKEENDNTVYNETEEEKKFLSLVEKVCSTKGDYLIETLASYRLKNALAFAGIRKISDLSRWSYKALLSIKNFGKVSYKELIKILTLLDDDYIPEEKPKKDYKFLFCKATKNKVRKYIDNPDAKKYLMSINYDKNHFEKGTIGRALCLRNKIEDVVVPKFSEGLNELNDTYTEYKDSFLELVDKTKELLYQFINEIVLNERNKDIVLLLLGQDGKKYPLEVIGNKYEITRERVRQVFKKELTRLSYGFNLNTEEGILRYSLRNKFLLNFMNCSVDAFLLFLKIEKLKYLEKAFRRVILAKIELPSNMDEQIDLSFDNIIKNKKSNKSTNTTSPSKTIKYNGFELMLGDDGDVLTDIELLDKLKSARLEIANKLGVPAFWVYHNKHLVILATFKPVSKEMYSSLSGFTEKTWSEYGSVMVNIIKEHLEKGEH